jgi:hypothetical protein
MKNKFKFLVKNKQNILALFVLLAMAFNACDDGETSILPVIPAEFTPVYLYVDSEGNYTENDSGRTVYVIDENAHVTFYSENFESADETSINDHVGLAYDDKSLVFSFEKDNDFPSSILLSNSDMFLIGYFSPYDQETQTYELTLVNGEEQETFSNILLNKDIFMQYTDNPELTQSQNIRFRNLYVAINIYNSLYNFCNSLPDRQSREIILNILSWVVDIIVPGPAGDIVVLTPSYVHKDKREIQYKERERWERKIRNAVFTRRNSRPKRQHWPGKRRSR